MTSQVHEFDAREGGSFRISLSYDAPGNVGKFETADPALGNSMPMITTPTYTDGAGEPRCARRLLNATE